MTTYTPEQLTCFFPWVVSCDTLKTEDLLVKFWSAAETLASMAGVPIPSPVLLALARFVGDNSSEDSWDDEAAAATLDEVSEFLQQHAPSGFYFGASVGDGACFGFWLDDGWIEALEHCGWAADSEPAALAAVITQLEAAGVDADNFESQYQGEAEGYNETEAGADYAAQLAEDLGAWDGSAAWPNSCIDWEAAWRELELSDNYWLQSINGAQWAVFRSC
jgi:hypothetical protein